MSKISGKLYVVGIGPGNYENMTLRANNALEKSDVIAGYTLYCDLVRNRFPDKEYIETPMLGEEKRVDLALTEASKGKTVSLICSGDAGVYGMSGLAVSMAADHENVEVEVVPGVTAALSGAALLGAPLINDFCVISLSDRLTPFETIETRLRLAAKADMSIVLYNPESKSRKGYLKRACDILMESIEPNRVCGIVWNIGREGEKKEVMTISELGEAGADMFSTIFIGSSQTTELSGFMATKRGYKSEV